MSWYRTYRPQTASSLHITPVREAFCRILTSGDFSHAYMLTGPKGTGKTSGARILAKILNCEKNRAAVEAHIQLGGRENATTGKGREKLHEPCNVCATCVSITNGTSLCVIEMDGASNRGIDDVRLLTERVGLSPADGAVNVVIIDEVHMLTTEAFNALLKVLEEPPAHVVFVLATTDLEKVPATVISRCMVIPYRKATSEEIITALRQIATKESIHAEESVFSRLAAYADGSFRDGVKALEQVARGKSSLTDADVAMVLGEPLHETAEHLVQLLAKRRYAQVAKLFADMTADGADMVGLQKAVLRALHDRMILAPTTNNPHFPTYVALLKSLNTPFSPLLPYPALPFEIACLEWCLGDMETPPVVTHGQTGKKKAHTQSVESNVAPNIPEEVVPLAQGNAVPSIEFAMLLTQWHLVLSRVREQNSSVEALLRTTTPKEMRENTLIVDVAYAFHKEQLESSRCQPLIEDVLLHLFATRVRILFRLVEKNENLMPVKDIAISGFADFAFVKAAEDAFLS